MYFDILIPAYNEADSIEFTLSPIVKLRDKHRDLGLILAQMSIYLRSVIVIDNGSLDATNVIARSCGAEVVYCAHRGYGSACLRGLDHIAPNPPDIVVFMDADGADDPKDLPKLLASLSTDSADVVIGSRVKDADSGSLTPVQKFGNALSCTLIRILFEMCNMILIEIKINANIYKNVTY